MDSLVNLLIVGAVAGLIIGLFPGGKGAGRLRNIVIGVVGAILGSFLYRELLSKVVNFNLPSITLDLNQVATALIGAVLLLVILRLLQRSGD